MSPGPTTPDDMDNWPDLEGDDESSPGVDVEELSFDDIPTEIDDVLEVDDPQKEYEHYFRGGGLIGKELRVDMGDIGTDAGWEVKGFNDEKGKVVLSKVMSTEDEDTKEKVIYRSPMGLVDENPDVFDSDPEAIANLEKEIESLSQEQREQLAWGARNAGYKYESIKDKWLAEAGEWTGEAAQSTLDSILGENSSAGETVSEYMSRFSERYRQKAQASKEKMADINKVKEANFSDEDSWSEKLKLAWDKTKQQAKDKGQLAIDAMKFGRVLFDPVRGGAIYGLMGLSTASGVAKEQRLDSIKGRDREPVEDMTDEEIKELKEEAQEEAQQLYKKAERKVQGDNDLPSREDIQNAFQEQLPEELLDKIEEGIENGAEDGIVSSAVSKTARFHIRKSAERWAKKIEGVENNPDLTREEKERKKEEYIHRFSRTETFKDFNRLLSDSGKIDTLAYGARIAQKGSQALVGALVLDGFMKMAENGYDYLMTDEAPSGESEKGVGSESYSGEQEPKGDSLDVSQDTSKSASIAGGPAPADSTDVAEDTLQSDTADIAGGSASDTSSDAADIAGGGAPEGADIAGGKVFDTLTPEQQDTAGDIFKSEWWEGPDTLSPQEQEFIDSIFSDNPPEWWQDLINPDTGTDAGDLTDDQKEMVESVFDENWLDPSERTEEQKEFIAEFFAAPDTESVGRVTDSVDPSEGLWSSGEDMVERGDISREEFMQAWGNPESTVMIDGEEVHISQVDLVHPDDTLVFEPGKNGEPPHFELESSSGYEPGTELPSDAAEEASVSKEDLPGGDIPEAEAVEPAGPEVGEFDIPEKIDAVSADSHPANGITKGAFHSYIKALEDTAYNPEYLSDLQIPDGMNQDEFASHIRELNDLDQPLQHLSDIAADEPDKYRALQSLFASYADANMTPPGVDVSDTEDLQALYDATESYINENAPAPEPPTDSAADSTEIEGAGRGADVSGSAEQTGGEVTGEGRGAEVDYSGEEETTSEPAESGGQDGQTSEPAQEGEGPSPETESVGDGAEDGEVESVSTGSEALGANQSISAEEMESIIEASDNNLETYPRNLAAKLTISDTEGLQVTPEELRDLIDTMPPQSPYDTITESIEGMNENQLENLYEILEYHQNNIDSVTLEPAPNMENEVTPLQEFIDDQYQELTGKESIQQALITEVPAGMSDEELLQYAQENVSEGEVFRSGDSAYVYLEEEAGSFDEASDAAEQEARSALSRSIFGGMSQQGSYLEQQAVSETSDGQRVGVLMEMPLN